MSKHTKGPWHTDAQSGFPTDIHTLDDDHTMVASAYEAMVPDDEAIANANLIAAAPELLESSEWLLDTVNRLINGTRILDLDERIAFSTASIKKAKGE